MKLFVMRVITSLKISVLVSLIALVPLRAFAQDALPEPLETLMRYETQLLDRSLNTARIASPLLNNQGADYRPEANKTFRVKTYWIDADRMHTFEGSAIDEPLANKLVRVSEGKRQIRLIVHPESMDFYRSFVETADPGPDLWARATSSSRTLLVWEPGNPNDAFLAKTSLDRTIAKADRKLRLVEALRSVGHTELLLEDRRNHRLPSSFDFFPEVFGTAPVGMEQGGAMVIRAIPKSVLRGNVRIVPLFALYAEPQNGESPLLAKMIAQSGMTAEAFIQERLIRPFAKQWFELTLKLGIFLSPHAQNVFVVLGRDGLPNGRFFHRDLGDAAVDIPYRERLGIATPRSLPRFARNLSDDYRTGEKVSSRFANVGHYFGEGFLFNLDQRLNSWIERGWLSRGRRVAEHHFRNQLYQELERSFRRMTQMPAGPRTEYDLRAYTELARDRFTTKRWSAILRAPRNVPGLIERHSVRSNASSTGARLRFGP